MKEAGIKIIYGCLYALILFAFVYLASKDYTTTTYTTDAERFYEEYNVPKENKFEYIGTASVIELIKEGTGVVFIGDKENAWSQKYATLLYDITKDIPLNKIYYYDARRVKLLQNKNYYDLLAVLDGNLIETDDSTSNLFTPSLYIIKEGVVIFHDSTSSVVNNEDTIDSYWTDNKIEEFKEKTTNALLDNGCESF